MSALPFACVSSTYEHSSRERKSERFCFLLLVIGKKLFINRVDFLDLTSAHVVQ